MADGLLERVGYVGTVTALVTEVAIGCDGPSGAPSVFPCYAPAIRQRLALAVFLQLLGGFFHARLVEVKKKAAAGVEKEMVIIYTAEDIAVGQQRDVTQTVGAHVAAVTQLWLEGLEIITVVTAQAVPSAYPNKTVLVLKNLSQMAVWKTVVLVIEFRMAKGLAKN